MADPPPLLARFGDFELDERNARLSRHGRALELQPKAFDVLCLLVRRHGQLLTKDALLDVVWGHRHVSDSVLKTVISALRGALGDDARQPRFIETASRRGYRFIAELDGGSPQAAEAAGGSPMPALIGRDAVQRELRARWARALQGQRQLVLVAGEAGIGKSTLIDRFMRSALPGQPVVGLGQCVEHQGAGEPYLPVLDALNMVCAGPDGGALPDLMRRVAPTWLAQLPWLLGDDDRQALRREVAGTTQDRMLREFGELLDRFGATRSLLLVLEDLHWSDPATVRLLDYLARRRTAAPLMLLGSLRPADVIVEEHPLAGVRQELRLHRLCHEIDLENFSEAEVGQLVAARIGGADAPEAFVRALHAHAGGLPLFTAGVIDELLAAGRLCRGTQGWEFPDATALQVPGNVAGVFDRQIVRLSAESRQVLAAASVAAAAGVEFSHLSLAGLLPLAPERVRAELDGAVLRPPWLRHAGTARLPDGSEVARYAFRHELYRHALYQGLGPAQRQLWHGQLAAALLQAPGGLAPDSAAAAVLHLERAGQPLLAVRPLATLAGRALARGAAHQALQSARHGLALLEAATELDPASDAAQAELDLRVLEGIALSRLFVLSEPEVAAAFERCRGLSQRHGASPARARALHGLWWVQFARGELAQARLLALEMLERAARDGDAALQLAGSSAMGLTLAMTGELEGAQAHLESVLTQYADVGDRLAPENFIQDPGVEARSYLVVILWWRGHPAAARRMAAEAQARAARLRHPMSQLIALHLSAVMHYLAGEHARGLALVDELYEVIGRYGLPTAPGSFSWLHGHMLAALGQVDEGLAEMHAAEASCHRMGLRVGTTGFHLHLAEACREAGRSAEALAAAQAGLAIGEERGERFLLAPLHRVLAEVQRDSGDLAAARVSVQAALTLAVETGARFHEGEALVCGLRAPALLPEHARARLAALLDEGALDDSVLGAQARALLARPTPGGAAADGTTGAAP